MAFTETRSDTLRPSIPFTLSFVGLVGGLIALALGLMRGQEPTQLLQFTGLTVVLLCALAFAQLHLFSNAKGAMIVTGVVVGIGGLAGAGIMGAIVFGGLAAAFSWFVFWLHTRAYRDPMPNYLTSEQVLWYYGFRVICGLVFFYLIFPILVIIPLSFNAQDFFTFTPEMLRLDPAGYSMKHYVDFLGTSAGRPWVDAFRNSLIIAPFATLLAVSLGTLAAIGLTQPHVPFRKQITALLISPMIVPLIISAAGMFFFYSRIAVQGSYLGVILAHAALGVPFVVITVTATLSSFDTSLTRAAANMGADPVKTFFKVQMPLILPGVLSGGLFAFITSFDEVIVVLLVGSAGQKTLPWQMFIGLREQISPTILAVATILVVISIALLTTVEMLRRRSERLRGMSPT
ncbi:MAG: putative spermidine/putrescine transport system permease protein [Rhodobacteraceae bacterium HLUCCA08]|nr:MAG: putative spermidine/putrescine transport system permease protein [Rhodobacteraceae bacterium HLUCCA08]